MVIHRRFHNGLPDFRSIRIQGPVVAIHDFARFREYGGAAFQIHKTCRFADIETQLERIIKMEEGKVVLAKPQVLKAIL